MRGVFVLLAAGAAALTIAAVAGRLAAMGGTPVVVVQPRSVVWGGRVFTNRPELERWLAARGATYPSWARRHQAEARRFEIAASAVPSQGTNQPRVVTAVAAVGGVALLSLGIAFLLRRRGRTLVPIRPRPRTRRQCVGVVPMPSARKLAALLAAGVRSQKPLAALVATRTVRAARSARVRGAQVGLLTVHAVSSRVPTSSGVRLGSQARLRRTRFPRAQLRPAVVYGIWLLASGLIGAVLVLSTR